MDARQIAERQIIERYLAGALSEEDAQAFEAYVEAHPEMIREIETIARMKSGLTTLQKRGELAVLLKPAAPAWYRRPAIVATLAASVAAVVFLIARPVNLGRSGAPLAVTLQELVGESGSVPTISSRISLSRSRGMSPAALSQQPGDTAIEVILQVSAPDSTAHHAVSLLRIADDSIEPVAKVEDLHANAEGNLAFFVSAKSLVEGSYLFRVTTEGREPQDFSVRMTRATN
jgi:hypothetical protein